MTDRSEYELFSFHKDVDVYHTGTERDAILAGATTEEARLGIEDATRVAADRLWRFPDGAYSEAC